MSENHQDETTGQENRPFIRETVINENKETSFGKKLLYTVLLAVAFGVIAAFSFHLTNRRLTPASQEETAATGISFPSDTYPGETEAVPETTSSSTELTGALPPDTPEDWRDQVSSMIDAHNLELKDTRRLAQVINSLATAASRSLVAVTATNREDTPFQTSYSFDTQSFGVIIAATSQEVLILTPYTATMQLSEDSSLTVTFPNLTTAGAYIKAKDGTADLMVLAVPVSQVTEATLSYIRVMPLGNSYACGVGQQIIALGSPAGYIKSMNYGILTYVDSGRAAEDNSVGILHSNLIGSANSSGFFINLDGSLIGWIDSTAAAAGGDLCAIGISDLKAYIEALSNGRTGAFLGIEGITLTADMQQRLNLTADGIYITRCLSDSPAESAGLQSGDILIEIAGVALTGIADLKSALLDIAPNQTVNVTVLREGRNGYHELHYDVKLEER